MNVPKFIISEHITLSEAVHSNTAKRKGIKNMPSPEAVLAMSKLAENVFEPLRAHVGGPIKVNSMFRSEELNKAIGGSKTSQHCKGEAIDIDDIHGYATNAEMFMFIWDNLDFDQLIWEFGTDENPSWVHVSYVSPEENRKRVLKADKINGKTVYSVMPKE